MVLLQGRLNVSFLFLVVFTEAIYLLESSTVKKETMSVQTRFSCISMISTALYWYFIAKRRTCNTKDTNIRICFLSQWQNLTVQVSSELASDCLKIFTWLSSFDHLVMQVLIFFHKLFWNLKTFTRSFVKPLKKRLIQFSPESIFQLFHSAFFGSFGFAIFNTFFNTFFFLFLSTRFFVANVELSSRSPISTDLRKRNSHELVW